MELVSHTCTTTTVVADERRFTSTAPSGEVYYTTVTAESHEKTVETPGPQQVEGFRRKTTIRTTLRRQVHRVAPYVGARPVRISSCSDTTTVAHERVVLKEEEE